MVDLRAELPLLLPHAIRWAEEESRRAAAQGAALAPAEIELAQRTGVRCPERVRLLVVAKLPEPDDAALRAAGRAAGLFGPESIGLTLGYAVFVRRGVSRRTLAHELRHVAQYESAGGIAAFLPAYLGQILEHGYAGAPLEADARAHEGT